MMPKLWIVPIEPLEERYSTQWLRLFEQGFYFLGENLEFVFGEPITSKIEVGEFLDVFGTNYYKASQIMELIKKIRSGLISDEDIILFLDGWFPGIESLFYIKNGADRKFKIYSCLHAGTWDPHDFLSRKEMTPWARGIELGWLRGMDGIFVATNFHKKLITDTFSDFDHDKIHVTGFPLSFLEIELKAWSDKKNIVVFPHRNAPEKRPLNFDFLETSLKEKFPCWTFIKTAKHYTKPQYYKILSEAKIAVSCALQETWGIAQQEALFSGCLPLVPNSLSYVEMYSNIFRYENEADALEKLERMMSSCDNLSGHLADLLNSRNDDMNALRERSNDSIKNMCNIFGFLRW